MKRSNNTTRVHRRQCGDCDTVSPTNSSIVSKTCSSSNSSSRCNKKQKKEANVVPLPFIVTLMDLPISIRVKILNYFDEKQQEELRTLTVISKPFYEDCKRPGIEWELVPLFLLRPLPNKQHLPVRIEGFIQKMREYDRTRNFQRYRRMEVKDPRKFPENIIRGKFERVTNNITQLYGIVSLKFSSQNAGVTCYFPLPRTLSFNGFLPRLLSRMVPNLCELDISNMNFDPFIVKEFCERCPTLEKITNNNNRKAVSGGIDIDGRDMQSATNLKEFMMDGSAFYCRNYNPNYMRDLHDHPTIFLFHKCGSTVLERLSMRNAKLQLSQYYNNAIIPQNALIKFVRKAPPTLKWFRSDLSKENIDMLRKERPEIELVN